MRARVVSMPSDHHFAAPRVALDAVRRALLALGDDPGRPVLLGIEPDAAESGFGWILPRGGHVDERPVAIERFVEKPAPAQAAALMRQGALWNSFLVVADARVLWQEFERGAPIVAAAFEGAYAFGVPCRTALLALYRGLPDVDFSRAVLEPAAERLTVLAVPECGWTDLGTPPRVAQCLAAHRDEHAEAVVMRPVAPAPVVLAHALDRRRADATG